MGRATYSSEQVEDLISRDAKETLDSIAEKKYEMSEYADRLDDLDLPLQKANKGQIVYLQFDRLAGSIIVVGIMVGSYKTNFPPGLRAMIAAYTTATGISRGMVKLNSTQLKLFLNHVVLLQGKINQAHQKLDKEAAYYCKIYSHHELCR